MTTALGGLRGRLLILCTALAALAGVTASANAATVARSGDSLVIREVTTGTGEFNQIFVTADDMFVYVQDKGTRPSAPAPPCVYAGLNTNSDTIQCPRASGNGMDSLAHIDVDLGQQGDSLFLNSTTLSFVDRSTVLAGPGADTVEGLIVGEDTVNGGDDSDILNGHGGNDPLSGGQGNDTLYGGNGADTLNGNADADIFHGGETATDDDSGNDTVDYSKDGNAAVVAIIGNAFQQSGTGCPSSNDCKDNIRDTIENLVGSAGNDSLTGSAAANRLTGNGGNDTLHGLAGSDTLNGSAGNDRLQGGLDNDTLDGDGDSDTVDYTERTEKILVNLTQATATNGGALDDRANDNSAARDTIVEVENADTGSGDDTLIGTDATGAAGSNTFHAGAGTDFMQGGNGPDQFFGEGGTDTVSYEDDSDDAENANGATVTIGDGDGNDGSPDDGTGARDTVHGDVENLIGGPDNDNFTGSSANNVLDGKVGSDTFKGLGGADTYIGEDGTDTVSYDGHSADVTADIDGNADDGALGEMDLISLTIENILGGSGNDLLIGSGPGTGTGANRLFGAAGDDELRGGLGSDSLEGGAGEDTAVYAHDVRTAGVTVTIGNNQADDGQAAAENDNVAADVENVVGTAFNDSLSGSGEMNRLFGLGGVDGLTGFGGNDVLDGGATAGDVLDGGPGNDTLHGGGNGSTSDGADQIDGGQDNDTVTYAVVPTNRATEAHASAERTAAVRIDLDAVNDDGATGENDFVNLVENAIGGAGDDTLIGTNGDAGVAPNRLDGRAGDDSLNGGTESAAPQADTLIGGPGARDLADYSTRPNTDNLVITLDGAANDGEVNALGEAIENDHVDLTVEDVTTADGNDTVTGNAGFVNRIKTAGGNDDVRTRDGNADDIDCGPGTDKLTADRRDTYVGCETALLPPQPLISVSGPQAPASEGGTATFRVSIDDVIGQPVTFSYTTNPGTATGDDFEGRTDTATIPAGSSFVDIPVSVKQDTLDEDAETFTLTISNPTNATLADGGSSAPATIADDDNPPAVSVGETSLEEGDSGEKTLSVPITLSAASSKPVTVKYSTSNGTATANSDYKPVTDGTVTIPAGATSATAPVTIIGDTRDEDDETFVVTLADNPTNATIGDGSGTQTIKDDDAPAKVSIGDAGVTEGNSGAATLSFPVTLSAASDKTVTVQYATAPGTATAPEDYTHKTGTVTFAPGETQKTIEVLVNGDTTPEADETLTVTLSNVENADVQDGSATGTINDDDAPAITVGDATATEGDSGTTGATFTVTLSQASGRPITVDYTTVGGSATEPGDFTETEGKLTFEPNETSKQVTVPVKGDALDEDNESFTLELSGASNATIADGTGTGTITDDDPTPALSLSGGEVAEGNDGTRDLVFTATLSAVSGRDVSVKFATADGTAKAGQDYTAATGTLTIKAGDAKGEIRVPVTGDTAAESDETFSLTLSEPQNATIAEGKESAAGLVKNDDTATAVPAINIDDVKVAEGDTGTTPAVFTISLSVPTTATVSVRFATANGTATAGRDYQAASGTLTFAPGERSKTVAVNVIGDRSDERDETFALALSQPQGATLQKAAGGALITDDETPRVAPKSVSARTTPSRDRGLPYRYRTTGRVTLPSGLKKTDGCAGKVQVRFKAGSKTISTRRANLRRDCTFSRSVSFGIKSRLKPGRLKVQVRFLGNAVLLPKSARTRFVRAG